MNEEKDFHETTFEPIEETPATDSTAVETPVVETPETVPDSTQVETPDNWEVRAKYWQSEAYKSGNLTREREAEAQRLRQELEAQRTPAEPELKRPPKPTVSHEQDPTAWIVYGAELAEYNASMMDRDNQRRETEKQEYLRQQHTMHQRNEVLGKLIQATNNPEKAQKILEHFADVRNLNNEKEYEVMYDAVIEYRAGGKKSSPRIEKAPPPPTGGGKALTEKLSPDDEFNQGLGQSNRYKL
jgi:hypothetical protein